MNIKIITLTQACFLTNKLILMDIRTQPIAQIRENAIYYVNFNFVQKSNILNAVTTIICENTKGIYASVMLNMQTPMK